MIMKLWCLFVVFLLFASSTSCFYLNEYDDALTTNDTNDPNIENSPSALMQEDRSERSIIVKRSQRNANILYRHCRRNGQAPHFCLKYAVRMILATGH